MTPNEAKRKLAKIKARLAEIEAVVADHLEDAEADMSADALIVTTLELIQDMEWETDSTLEAQ